MSKIKSLLAFVALMLCGGAWAEGTADENGIVPSIWYTFDEGVSSVSNHGSYTAKTSVDVSSGTFEDVEGTDKAWKIGTSELELATINDKTMEGKNVYPTTYRVKINFDGQTYDNAVIWGTNGQANNGPTLVVNGNPTDGYTVKLYRHASGNIGTEKFSYTVPQDKVTGYHSYVVTIAAKSGGTCVTTLYVDGVNVGTFNEGWTGTQNSGTLLGKCGNGYTKVATGLLYSDFRFYTQTLTCAQVAMIEGVVATPDYSADFNNTGSDTIHLVASSKLGGTAAFVPAGNYTGGDWSTDATYVAIRDSENDADKAITINDKHKPYQTSGDSIGSGDFSLLAVAKMSVASSNPKVLMHAGSSASASNGKGVSVVYYKGKVYVIAHKYGTDASYDPEITAEVTAAEAAFHSYLLTYDNTNKTIKFFVDGAQKGETVTLDEALDHSGYQLGGNYGGTNYVKLKLEDQDAVAYAIGEGILVDEMAIWKGDVSYWASEIAAKYPVWPKVSASMPYCFHLDGDESNSGYLGGTGVTVHGTSTWATSGALDSAKSYTANSTEKAIVIENAEGIATFEQGWTISMWVQANNLGTWRDIAGFTIGNVGYRIERNGGTAWRLYNQQESPSADYNVATYSQTSDWTHLAIISNSDGSISVYGNGTLTHTFTPDTNKPLWGTEENAVHGLTKVSIGQKGIYALNGGGHSSNANVDEVAIYTKSLSATQIAELAANAPSSDVVAEAKIGEKRYVTIQDAIDAAEENLSTITILDDSATVPAGYAKMTKNGVTSIRKIGDIYYVRGSLYNQSGNDIATFETGDGWETAFVSGDTIVIDNQTSENGGYWSATTAYNKVRIAKNFELYSGANGQSGVGTGVEFTVDEGKMLTFKKNTSYPYSYTIGSMTLKGSGTVEIIEPNAAPSQSIVDSTWTGTVLAKGFQWADINLNLIGNENSVVQLSKITGHTPNSNDGTAGYDGTVEFVDADGQPGLKITADYNSTYYFNKVTGSGTFQTVTDHNSKARFAMKDVSKFTGTLDLAGHKGVVIGDVSTADHYGTQTAKLVINSNKTANIANDKTWTASEDGITVNGTIKGSGTLGSATTFGDNATIDLSDGALTASAAVTFNSSWTLKIKNVNNAGSKVMNLASALTAVPGRVLINGCENSDIGYLYTKMNGEQLELWVKPQFTEITAEELADMVKLYAIPGSATATLTITSDVTSEAINKIQLGSNVTLAYGWKPGKIISMNLNSGNSTQTQFYMSGNTVDGTLGGSVPRNSWNNLEGGAGTKTVTLGYNSEGAGSTFPVYGMSLVITATGTYNSGIGGQVVAPFMHGYIDDSWQNTTANTYTLSGIPFAKYDVIVYFQGDTNDDEARFGAIQINDTTKYGFNSAGEVITGVADNYTWGKSRQAKFAYGVNAIRIAEQTGSSIKITPLRPTTTQRSSVAAIQIVRTSTDQEEAEASEATVTTGDTTVTHLTLASALAAAESGSTVTLLKTVAGGNAVLKDGVTLEVGNYTVTGALDIKTGAIITKNDIPKIDGFATSFDVTYANVNAFAYRYKDTGTCRSDNGNNPGYNNSNADKSTGAMLKNHPWIQDIEEAFFTSTKQLTLATAGVMPQANNTIFTHMGSSKADTSYGLYLATGASDDEVIVGYNKGSGTNLITKITVPNARSTRHTYVITKDDVTEGDSKTTFVIYLDGLKWKTFVRKPRFEITGGFQSGSDFGGNVVQAGNLASVASTDSKSYVNFLRVYNRIISEAEIAQYSVDSEYPYTSPNGTYTRNIAADGNWVAADQWSDGSSNVEKPSAKGNVKLTATHAEGDAASTKTVTVNLNEEVQYEKLTLSGGPMIFESATASKPIKSVATVIGTTVTLKEGAIDLTAGPTIIVEGGKLVFDFSSLTEAAVAEHPIDEKVTDEIDEDENIGTDDAKIAVLKPSEMGRMFVELRYIDSCYHVVAALKPVYLKSDNTLALEDGTAVTSLYDNEQIVVSSVGYVGNARWGVNLNNDKLIGHPIYIDYSNNGNDPGVSVSGMLGNHAIEIAEGSVMYVAENIDIQNATITGDGTFKLTRPINVNGTLSIASAFSAVETGKLVLKTAAATVTVPAAIDSSRVECGVEAMSVKVTTNNDNTVTYSLIGRLATIAGVDCFTKDDILAHPAGTITNIGNGLTVNGDGHLELNGEDLMIAENEGVISPIVEAAEDHNLIISEICPKLSAWDENHKDAGWLELHNTGSKWVNFSEYTLGRYNRGKAVKATEWTNRVTLSIAPGARLVVKTSEDYSAKSVKTIVQYGNDLHNAIVFDSKVNPKKYPLVVLIKGGKVVQNCVVPVDVPENMSVCYDGELKSGAIASYITTASKGEASNFEGAVAVGPQISPLYAVKDAVDPWQKFQKATIGEAYPITVPVNPIMDGNAKNEIASVKLIYRIDFGDEVVVEPPMTKSETKDAKNGYTYTGEIPGSAITTAGQLVRWAVQITDVGGNEWRSPSFNYGDDGYQYFGTIVKPSEEQLSGGLNTWHLFADPDEVADGIGTANKNPNALMNKDADESGFTTTRHPNGGRVGIYDMETGLYYDNVRIDKRGRTTGAFTKKAHGLKFSKSQPFTGTDSLSGEKIECRKSSITAEYGDPTFIRQELAFEVMRRNGVKAPFHYPVRLNLNGQFYQLAFHSERFSDELIEDFYGLDPKGYGYKNVGTFHNGTNNSSERKTPDDGSRDLTTNDPVLKAFCDTLNGVNNIDENTDFAANPTYSSDVSKVVTQSFDLPAWINYMAATKITAETDDTWANLSAYYDINGTGTWMPLAYDMNQSLGQWHFADDRARGRIGLVADKDDFKSHPFYGGLHIRMHNNAGNASGNPNYAYEAIFQSEKFRRLFLRRLRTIMDKEIGVTVYADQASEKSALFTSAAQMVATINELGLKDRSIWTDYANVDFANNTDRSTNGSCDKIWVWPESMTTQLSTPQGGLKDLWDNYIAPRRAYLYGKHLASNGSVAVGYGLNLSAGIPAAQSDIATLKGTDENPKITARYDATLGTVIIENDNDETIDLSGWKLTGPVTMTIPEGTVLDQKVGGVKGQVYLTANRKATIAAFGAALADQVIVGNGAANGAETPISLRTPEGVRVVGEPTAQELYIRFDAFYGATLGDGDENEWFSIKNIGEAAVEYTGMTVCILKDGDGEEKDHCHVTLPEGTLEAGASKKFVKGDFATGFVKIQNNTVNISVYDLYMSPVQKMQVTQKDYTWAYLHGAYLEHQTDSGKWHQVWDSGDLTLADYLSDKGKNVKALAKDLYVRAAAPMTITLENPSFDASSTLKISGEGKVTITGTLNATVNTTAIKSTGNLIFADGSYTITAGDDCIQADGDITINGGTFICHSTGNDGIDSNQNIVINGGTIFAFTAATETDGNKSTGLDVNEGHSITINGGTVIATSLAKKALEDLTIADGSQVVQIVEVSDVSGATKAIGDVIVTFPTMDPAPAAVLVSTPTLTDAEITPEEVSDGIELVAADGDAPAKSVVVPASWAAGKTDEQKVAAAEAFVLGLAEPTEKPMVSSEQTAEADSIRIVDNVAPRFGTGVTVKRTLFVGTTPDNHETTGLKESGVEETNGGFTVPLPTGDDKVKYLKIKYSFK